MPIPRPKFQRSPQQPTLSVEMFPEQAANPQSEIAPKSLAADVGPSLRCEPGGVWRTLAEPDKARLKSGWTRTMREVAHDTTDG